MALAPREELEQLTDEDRAYTGSRFSDVVDAVFANPYQRVWCGAGEPPLPVGEVTFRSVVGGIFTRPDLFRKACERTLDSSADLRWGADRKGFRRLVHPNGVCLIGQWRIVEETGYSGYFSKGSTALVVARYSTCSTETKRDARARSRWLASSFLRPIPTIRSRFAPPISSRRRISAAPNGVHQRR